MLFGLVHFAYGSWTEVVLACISGFILGFIFLKRKNIIAPIISHELLNLMTLVLVYTGV